jgi:hypothetical protein
LICSRSALAM